MKKTRINKEDSLSEEEINAELAKLFESDVKEFSENGAKAFGHILVKHGIDNPQKWFEEKMRETSNPQTPPYSFEKDCVLPYCAKSGIIYFPSLKAANNRFTRAHEMAHKITSALIDKIIENKRYSVFRSGFYIPDIKMKINRITGKTKEIYCVDGRSGRAFNEGVTNLIAEKLSGLNYSENKDGYTLVTNLVMQIAEISGEDTVFEAAFFNPNILSNKWQNLTDNKHSFPKIVHSFNRLQLFYLGCMAGKNKIRKMVLRFKGTITFKQIEKELRKYPYLVKNSCKNGITQSNTEERKSSRQRLQNIRAKLKQIILNEITITKFRSISYFSAIIFVKLIKMLK